MNTRIVIIAKAPQPGRAKTRLIPALGADGAAHVARELFTSACHEASLASHPSPDRPAITAEMCVSPHPEDPVWATLPAPDGAAWSAQVDGDLGARMADATHRASMDGHATILMGTDCPTLTHHVLTRMATLMTAHPPELAADVALVPALDGGYVALGTRQHYPQLFTDMPWSTADVANITLQRCTDSGLRTVVLDALADIDVPDDLTHLPRHMFPSTFPTQATTHQPLNERKAFHA